MDTSAPLENKLYIKPYSYINILIAFSKMGMNVRILGLMIILVMMSLEGIDGRRPCTKYDRCQREDPPQSIQVHMPLECPCTKPGCCPREDPPPFTLMNNIVP